MFRIIVETLLLGVMATSTTPQDEDDTRFCSDQHLWLVHELLIWSLVAFVGCEKRKYHADLIHVRCDTNKQIKVRKPPE